MRVQDTTDAVYDGLYALDPRRYLCAMWIVCGGLRAIYSDRLTTAEGALMTSTLNTVRDVVIRGDAAPGVAKYAADLSAQWAAMTSQWAAMPLGNTTEVTPGHWNTWMVFRDLAGEIAGPVGGMRRPGESTWRPLIAGVKAIRVSCGMILMKRSMTSALWPARSLSSSEPLAESRVV